MKHKRLLYLAIILGLVIALYPLAPASAAVVCTVNYSNQNDWGSGATVNVAITNSGTTAVNGWTLTWDFPGNQQINNLWNGSYTQSGASVSVKNLSYNASIPANGGSTSFGFNITYSGTNTAPTSFTLNGVTCNGGTPPPTTPPPTTPPPTTPPPTTPPPTTPPPTTPPPTTPPPTTPPAGVCQVGYTMSQWNNGFTADVKITNNGSSAIQGWTLAWSFANGQQITGSWNATVSQSGANVTASNPASNWNGTIGANGGSASFGFQATHTGTNAVPTSFTLNGVACNSGTVTPPTTPPPTTPPPTTPPPTTPPPTTPPAVPVWRVDANGNITKDGVVFHIHGGSWFGLEGRHEPSNDSTNPSGAPMEQYMGNVFWAPSGRTYMQDVNEFKAMGINVVRIPLVHQTLDANDPQGKAPNLKNDPSVVIANSRLALETVIKDLNDAGLYVLLDIHSCSNYVGWRAGRLDARPPYVDANRDNYDFTREDSSCAASNNPSSVTRVQAYNETLWLQDLQTLAGMQSSLGVSNIMGIDIFNEPWDYTWAEWSTLAEDAYTTINAVNPNVLIFVQGVSATAENQDGTPDTITQVPYGGNVIPNWGGNLYEAGANPPNIPKDRLVFSPHVYGPSVYVGAQFMDPAQPQCAGLEGDPAGDAQCNIVISPTLLQQGWDDHWGYLKAMGYAVVIGEFGGNPDWPGGKASLRDQNRYSYLTDKTVDWQWQTAFVNYLISKGITDTIYWSINPESGDTGGLYTTPYQPGSNESGWGTWGALDTRKINLLNLLWGN
jgi:endoglucanase